MLLTFVLSDKKARVETTSGTLEVPIAPPFRTTDLKMSREVEPLFTAANKFLTLETTEAEREELRGIYQSIYTIINHHRASAKANDTTEALTRLIKLFPISRLQAYCKTHAPIPPNDFEDVFDTHGGIYSRAQTYLTSDYIELIGVVVWLQLALPLTANYMISALATYGAQAEMHILDDIMPKELVNDQVVEKLLTYIRTRTDKVTGKTLNVSRLHKQDISSGNLDRYILSDILIRRTWQVPVLKAVTGTHAVNTIYQSLLSKTSASNPIDFKTKVPRVGNGEDADSAVGDQRYVAKEPIGLIAEYRFCSDQKYWHKFVKGKYVEAEYKRVLKQVEGSEYSAITQPMLEILVYFYTNILAAPSITMATKSQVDKLRVVAFLLLRDECPTLAAYLLSAVCEDTGSSKVPTLVEVNEKEGDLSLNLPAIKEALSRLNLKIASEKMTLILQKDQYDPNVYMWDEFSEGYTLRLDNFQLSKEWHYLINDGFNLIQPLVK